MNSKIATNRTNRLAHSDLCHAVGSTIWRGICSVVSSATSLLKSAKARLIVVPAAVALTLSLAACSGLDEADKTANMSAEKMYQLAKQDMDSGNFDAAAKAMVKLEARYPFGVYAQQAQLDSAYIKFKLQEPAEALIAVDRFMRLHPNHSATDYALYLKGLVNFNENQGLFARLGGQDLAERDLKAARDAFENYRELEQRFPQSKYAPDARLRMNYLINSIADGEVHVARYYFRRGAYVAAVNRAKEVVKIYNDAPAIEEALYILMRSYQQLGINDLADDTERVLRKNYPKSDFFAKGVPTNQRAWWEVWK